MSFILLGILNSAAGGVTPGPYFIGTYGDSNIVSNVADIALDSSGNLYTGGRSYPGSGGYQALVFSWSGTGTPRWIKRFGGGNNDVTGVDVDSGDNVIITGYTGTSATGGSTSFINKFNSSGTSQWAYELESTGEDEGEALVIDSSDNTYATGWSNFGIGRKAMMLKRNSSGTIQWQRQYGNNGDNQQGNGFAINGGHIYQAGYITVSGNIGGFIHKIDSGGGTTWQALISGSGTEDIQDVAVDSTGAVYGAGYTTTAGAGPTNAFLVKYNSTGSLQYRRVMGTSAVTTQFLGVAVDSSDNIFTVGRTGSNNGFIAKFDSSGNLLFQREITGYSVIQDVVVDSNDDIYCSFITNNAGAGNYDNGIMYLPGDGSRMSTVTVDGYDFTYQEATTTLLTTASIFNYNASQTNASSSLTDASIGFSYASPGFTQYLTLV